MAGGKKREALAKCGAKNRQGQPCARPAGWGTDHVGSGRCKMHGGKTPIKHGRYSKTVRERLGPILEQLEADPDPLNLLPELHLLRAMANHWLETSGGKPAPIAADLLEKVVRVAELISKRQKEGVVSMASLQRLVEQMGVSVMKVVSRHVEDAELRDRIFRDIERDWDSVALS
jgi:hypothetical protein